MADLPELAEWTPGIYQLETSDPVLGGPEGIDNLPSKQLANRSVWLKQRIASLESGASTAGKAAVLANTRSISITGDGSWSVSFNGSANVAAALVLSNSGVVAGTYGKVTVNAKGLVVGGSALLASDIPSLDWTKITTGKPTTLSGYGIIDAQPLDSDLTALAALTTQGFYVNTGVGTVEARALTVTGPGLSLSNGNGVAGNPALVNTGVTSVAGTANQVVVSGANGAVTFSLPQSIHNLAVPSFGQVALGADPVSAMQAATKQYVDNLISGLNVKESVLVGTTTNITLSGTQTIDGVAVNVGSRVLVKNQTAASQNGLYIVAAGAWVRSTDADTWNELVSAFVFVERGTQNADTGWVCTVDTGGTLGSTAVVVSQFAGAGTVTAGPGIAVTGNQVSLGPSGVAAGTYTKLSVDGFGRVTAATALTAADVPNLDWTKITTGKPTTLSGYSISTPSQAQAEDGTDNTLPMTPLRVLQAITKRVVQATYTVAGIAQFASASDLIGTVSESKTLSPAVVKYGFAVLKAPNGYIAFPSWLGGFIIQWGTATIPASQTAVSYPLTYPNAEFVTLATASNASLGLDGVEINSAETSLFRATIVSANGAASQVAGSFKYISCGW